MSVHGQLLIMYKLIYQPVPRWSVTADMAADAATVMHEFINSALACQSYLALAHIIDMKISISWTFRSPLKLFIKVGHFFTFLVSAKGGDFRR